jgi:hypothetical protein
MKGPNRKISECNYCNVRIYIQHCALYWDTFETVMLYSRSHACFPFALPTALAHHH